MWRILIPVSAVLVASDLAILAIAGCSWKGFAATVIVMLLGALSLLGFVKKAVRPIEKLGDKLRQLASEGTGIGGRIEAEGHDDLVAIASDFNILMERLGALVDPLASRTEPLIAAASDLSDFSKRMPEQLAVMDATTTTVLEATRKASNDLAGISGSLQDVSACIGMLSSSADDIAKSLAGVAGTCQEEVVMAGSARAAVGAAPEVMEGLRREAEAIGGILSEIQAIASRTRLLALNATIEAARAGEAGKGFAVVAGEVKELSSQTAASTDRIRAMVGSIRGAIQSAVEAMDRISARVGDVDRMSRSIEDSVRRQTGTIAEISSNVKFVDDQAATISEVVTESGLQLSETATIISNLKAPLAAIEADARLVGVQSDSLSKLGVELATMVEAFQRK
ncbi:MAG: methyl-accepting chemotaxis protein [Fibrobacterota bacterium]